MKNFIDAVRDVLEERNKTIDILFKNNIIPSQTFYKLKQRHPSLNSIFNVANYLCVTIDYLYELSNNNNFKPYSLKNLKFYENLTTLIKKLNISYRKFCKDLHFSKDNIRNWEKGTCPTFSVIIEIKDYFNCSFDDLLG